MQYRHATNREDYSDYAGGRVFYSSPGQPAFPVRLASELFQRAYHYWQGNCPPNGRCLLYDPCCGGAYHLAVLGQLHPDKIATVIGSDYDAKVLQLAQRNLNLLTEAGWAQRRQEIEALLAKFGKPSHHEALASVQRLQAQRATVTNGMPIVQTLQANALQAGDIAHGLAGREPDIVFADVPYGWLSGWQGANEAAEEREGVAQTAVSQLLTALLPNLTPNTIVIIASDKKQKATHPSFRRLERLRAGKRQIFILQPQQAS